MVHPTVPLSWTAFWKPPAAALSAAGPGEVLVRLHASGINPSDVKKRAGSFPDLLDDGFVIPNSER